MFFALLFFLFFVVCKKIIKLCTFFGGLGCSAVLPASVRATACCLLQHDASVFRDLNDRLVNAVRVDRQFEAALSFPRAADDDRADRIVDFEHLQVQTDLQTELVVVVVAIVVVVVYVVFTFNINPLLLPADIHIILHCTARSNCGFLLLLVHE